jgi:hypothetical protein
MAHADRLEAGKPCLHDAALVVVARFRAAALVAEVDFHARDSVAEPPKGALDDGLDLADQLRAALDVVVCVN